MAQLRSWLVISIVATQGCKPAQDRAQDRAAHAAETSTQRPVHARTPDELVAATSAFRAKVTTGTLPGAADPAFVAPPSEAELAWVTDRSLPLAQRVETALKLTGDLPVIMRAYAERDARAALASPATARDSTEMLRWTEPMIRLLGPLGTVLVEEFMPTVPKDDPSYAVRLEGAKKIGSGSTEMMRGGLVTLKAQRSELRDRQLLADAWSDVIGTYAKHWDVAQCDGLVPLVREVAAIERDPAIAASLRTILVQLAQCQP
jgi:hypothetical protein